MQPYNFLEQSNKRIALMGMSGVGKTTLSNMLPKSEWFHYSIDYRIGTRYLHEEISDLLKAEAMKSPALAKLLRSDSIFIAPNITLDNLTAISMFIGMVGELEKGGLPLDEFLARLQAHRIAEIQSMEDTKNFINKATNIYGYPHFICDFSGSVCEIDAPEVIQNVADECLLIYIKATDSMMSTLIDRAQKYPKPLYYQADFLHSAIQRYCTEQHLYSWKEIDPAHFAMWVFPHLVEHRMVRYSAIAEQHGITLSAEDTLTISSGDEFLDLIHATVQQQSKG